MVDAGRVEGAGVIDAGMDFVAVVEKKVGEVAAVLSCDAGDEGFYHGMRLF